MVVIPMASQEVYEPVSDTHVTSTMGFRVHPVTGERCFHNGVDFAADLNDPVYNLLDGVVVQSGERGLMGLAVEVFHPSANVRTIVGHLNGYSVKPGQWIKRGRVIGYAGSTGRSTGVHVHYSVRGPKGEWQDPLKFIDQVPQLQKIADKQLAKGQPIVAGKFGKYGDVKVTFAAKIAVKVAVETSKPVKRHTSTAARFAYRWDTQLANS
jgi:murein DD-endopeptidase MepM/ murein hydrolase activator NlpD